MHFDYITDLRQEFKGYNSKKLVKDVFAGLTVAAVALPLALAFGVSSGADAAAGLITAIVAGFVISALSGAYYQISGPTGAMAAVLISIIARYQIQGVFIATLMAGILLVLAGIFHLGKLTSFIPAPVITGFTSGIAVIIVLGQIDNFFGTSSAGDTAVSKLISYTRLGFKPDIASVLVGLFVILFMVVFPKKWNAVVPASLIGIVLATVSTSILGVDVKIVGEIPKTLIPLNRLSLTQIDLRNIGGLIGPAVSIAMLGMIESLMCGTSAGRMTGVHLNSDRELIAQGVGNIVLPFFGGIPATAAIARTSVAVKSGAVTRLTGIFHGLFLMLSLLVLSPVMSKIPLPALAGVLIVTAWRMNEWESINYVFSHNFKGGILKFLITMVATIIFDLTIAILIGVAVALVLLVNRLSKIEVNYEKVDMARINTTDSELKERYSNSCVVYITGPIIFANTKYIEQIPENVGEESDTVLLSMRGVSHIDITGIQALMDVLNEFRMKNIDFIICGLPNTVKETIRKSGIHDLVGEDGFYWSVERALFDKRPAKTMAV